MKSVVRSAMLPFTAEQMFDVVNDVARYQEFLPWCSGSEIIEASSAHMLARLTISKGAISQDFITNNALHRPHGIDMDLVEGPFTALKGKWKFVQLGDDGCKIEMNLRFNFSTRLVNLVIGKTFEHAADTLVDAFCERASRIYSDAR